MGVKDPIYIYIYIYKIYKIYIIYNITGFRTVLSHLRVLVFSFFLLLLNPVLG